MSKPGSKTRSHADSQYDAAQATYLSDLVFLGFLTRMPASGSCHEGYTKVKDVNFQHSGKYILRGQETLGISNTVSHEAG